MGYISQIIFCVSRYQKLADTEKNDIYMYYIWLPNYEGMEQRWNDMKKQKNNSPESGVHHGIE